MLPLPLAGNGAVIDPEGGPGAGIGGEPIGQELEVADRVDVPAGAAMPGPDEAAEPSQAERVRVADLDSGAGRTQRRDRLPGREARSFAQDDPHGDPEASQLAGLETVTEGESANSVGEGTLDQVTAIRSKPGKGTRSRPETVRTTDRSRRPVVST